MHSESNVSLFSKQCFAESVLPVLLIVFSCDGFQPWHLNRPQHPAIPHGNVLELRSIDCV